jgi:hypothetical protein
MILKKIGYFDNAVYVDKLDAAVPTAAYPKKEVVEYLVAGIKIFSWLEDVRCIYGCTASNLGSVEMTDGVWVWTQEFIHYVDCHYVPIPQQFQIFLKERSYKLFENENLEKIRSLLFDPSALEAEIRYSDDVWTTWLSENQISTTVDRMRHDAAPSKPKFDLPDDW